MDERVLGCTNPKCTNIIVLNAHKEWKHLRCDGGCKAKLEAPPYSCAKCDIDYCYNCYEIKRTLLWSTPTPERKTRRVVESSHPPPARRRARFE